MEDDLELQKQITQLEELVKAYSAALTEAQNQLAGVISERQQALAEQERYLAVERNQTRRQAALLRLSADLAATVDEAEVCWCVVRGLRETLGHAVVALFLLEESSGDRVLAAQVGFEAYCEVIPNRIKPGVGLSARPLLDGKLHYTPDVSQDPSYLPGAGGCEVDLPVCIGGKVIGVLSAENEAPNAFHQDDFEVLTAAAHQAGLAIEKARLLAAERQRADELDALRTTLADITAELELSSLLRAIVARATSLLNATGGELGLYDQACQEVRIVVSHNLGESYLGVRHGLGEGAMGSVAETRQPMIIEDYLTWEASDPRYADANIHAILAAPLMVGGRLVGVITISTTDRGRQFNLTDLHLLELFAQQAAIAIENARLFEAEQRRADQFQVINEVGRHITSLLAPGELLWEIARLIKQTLGFYLVGIALIEGEYLVFKAGAGAVWELPDFQPPSVRIGQEGITGWVAYSGEPLLVPDLSKESRYYSLPESSEMQSELAVPLKTKERVIGVLHVQSDRLNAFDQSDLSVLQSLSIQAAISIENARLYDQAQQEIAERYKLEGEIRRQKEVAEAANQAKSVFLANMSHELRTPLNAILGFTQLMESDPNLTAEQQENLGIINRSGEHLLSLINDVLEMSKIEAGRVSLQAVSFDLHRLLDTLEEMFRLRAEDKGLALYFELAPNVPQFVQADEGKLRQVLMNLLGNAVKFTEEGGVVLRVASGMDAGSLIFEFEDTGPGIALEELEAVFEPFVQTESGRQALEGTGLGLAISRQFARLMGGDITVSSTLGQGSVFRLEAPVGPADLETVVVARSARQVLGLEAGQAVYRLLVVDDRETTRQLLVKLLGPLGFEIREAVNGQEAVEIWESWKPHLIWMDIRMPVMDGYEATRRIKAAGKDRAPVIVALTASAFQEDRETILSAGCDDVVRKPFRKNEIFDMLSKHLKVRFVYEAEPALQAASRPVVQEALAAAARAALEPGWLAELQQATIRADYNLILALIDQIRPQHAALAEGLAELARDFEYNKILAFIEGTGGQP